MLELIFKTCKINYVFMFFSILKYSHPDSISLDILDVLNTTLT